MTRPPKPKGRPRVGERVAVRLPPELLARVDAQAAGHAESRASSIRRLLAEALATRDDGVDRGQILRMLALSPRERIRHMADITNGMARLHDRTRRATA
jgi:metal-responsive CopG/Arc/MetJ family transcriptional regulator